jgi:hypothetical protein
MSNESPSEVPGWLEEMKSELAKEEEATYRMSIFAHRATTLCAKIKKIVNAESGKVAAEATANLLTDAQAFEEEMKCHRGPTAKELENNSAIGADLRLRAMVSRIFLSAFHLKFQVCMLDFLRKLHAIKEHTTRADDTQLRRDLGVRISSIRNAADDILACVPFLFSNYSIPGQDGRLKPTLFMDGMRLIWPLRLIVLWEGPTAEQRRAARHVLNAIRVRLGGRQDSGGEGSPQGSP